MKKLIGASLVLLCSTAALASLPEKIGTNFQCSGGKGGFDVLHVLVGNNEEGQLEVSVTSEKIDWGKVEPTQSKVTELLKTTQIKASQKDENLLITSTNINQPLQISIQYVGDFENNPIYSGKIMFELNDDSESADLGCSPVKSN
jgi:hypothetical protein